MVHGGFHEDIPYRMVSDEVRANAAEGACDDGRVYLPPQHPKGEEAAEEEVRQWQQAREKAIEAKVVEL